MSKHWYVYVLVAAEEVGPAYFKIGVSQGLGHSAARTQLGCPVPVRSMIAVKAHMFRQALTAERRLKRGLKQFQHDGWFKVDLDNPRHEEVFKAASEATLCLLGEGAKWTHYDVGKVRQMARSITERKSRKRNNTAIDETAAEC